MRWCREKRAPRGDSGTHGPEARRRGSATGAGVTPGQATGSRRRRLGGRPPCRNPRSHRLSRTLFSIPANGAPRRSKPRPVSASAHLQPLQTRRRSRCATSPNAPLRRRGRGARGRRHVRRPPGDTGAASIAHVRPAAATAATIGRHFAALGAAVGCGVLEQPVNVQGFAAMGTAGNPGTEQQPGPEKDRPPGGTGGAIVHEDGFAAAAVATLHDPSPCCLTAQHAFI